MARLNTAVRPQLVTLQDVSEMLSLSTRTIRNKSIETHASHDPNFPTAILLGGTVVRYDLAEIESYIDQCAEVTS